MPQIQITKTVLNRVTNSLVSGIQATRTTISHQNSVLVSRVHTTRLSVAYGQNRLVPGPRSYGLVVSPSRVGIVRVGGTYNIMAGGTHLEIPFDYGDATPKSLATLEADKLVLTATIIITEGFDGIGAALSIGDTGMNDRLMTTDSNDPTEVGEYETNPVYAYPSNTLVRLYITPGAGASQGSGIVVLDVQS